MKQYSLLILFLMGFNLYTHALKLNRASVLQYRNCSKPELPSLLPRKQLRVLVWYSLPDWLVSSSSFLGLFFTSARALSHLQLWTGLQRTGIMVMTVLSLQALDSEREVLWHLVDFGNSYHFCLLCVGVPLLLKRRGPEHIAATIRH